VTDILIPVGRYLGQYAQGHRVRVGGADHWLGGQLAETWLLAFGVQVDGREADALTDLGLLARLDPTDAEAFARAHRMRPLLTGLGAHPDLPGTYALGLPGEPLVLLPEFAFEVWQWAGAAPDLWTAGEAFADLDDDERVMALEAGEPVDVTPIDADDVLTDLVYALRLLLEQQAAYLDRAEAV